MEELEEESMWRRQSGVRVAARRPCSHAARTLQTSPRSAVTTLLPATRHSPLDVKPFDVPHYHSPAAVNRCETMRRYTKLQLGRAEFGLMVHARKPVGDASIGTIFLNLFSAFRGLISCD